jgi:hypothetical protein
MELLSFNILNFLKQTETGHVLYISTLDVQKIVHMTVPRVQVKRRPSASSRTHSDGPVSQTRLLPTLKARADNAPSQPSMTRLHNEELVK